MPELKCIEIWNIYYAPVQQTFDFLRYLRKEPRWFWLWLLNSSQTFFGLPTFFNQGKESESSLAAAIQLVP